GTNPQYHPEADKFEVEDFGVAMIRLENDIILNFKISWAMHMETLGPTIFLGKKAGLKLTSAGEGPWSGVWDGGLGYMSLFHDDGDGHTETVDRKSTRLNSSHVSISYAVFCLKKKN